ncbi:hypothetical protein D3C86_1558080 [compost metagenome]
MPLAYAPPTSEPMLVPAMQSTGTRSSSSTFSTPIWAAPRAPPPDNTRQILGRPTGWALAAAPSTEPPGVAGARRAGAGNGGFGAGTMLLGV